MAISKCLVGVWGLEGVRLPVVLVRESGLRHIAELETSLCPGRIRAGNGKSAFFELKC